MEETEPPQLNPTLAGGHFTPSILSASALHSPSGRPRQESLTFIPPPPPPSIHPLLLHPKEEEVKVEVSAYGTLGAEGGGTKEEEEEEEEEEECSGGVMEEREYYEVEVELLESYSDDDMLTPSEVDYDVTTAVTDDVTASDPAYEPPESISLSSWSSDDVTGGRGLLRLLQAVRRAELPPHWVAVLADGPELQLLQCSRLSSMADTVIHIRPDRCFYITVQSRRLPDTHTVYRTHTHRITHLSQLVSLLLKLERLNVCRGSRLRSSACRAQVRSPACHLLLATPCLTCLPCLQGEEEDEDDDEE